MDLARALLYGSLLRLAFYGLLIVVIVGLFVVLSIGGMMHALRKGHEDY